MVLPFSRFNTYDMPTYVIPARSRIELNSSLP